MYDVEQGVIEAFLDSKNFGFIRRPGRQDLFFHGTELRPEDRRRVRRGVTVEFKVAEDQLGRPKAVDLELIDQETRH